MSRRRQSGGDEHDRGDLAPEPFYTPFRTLERLRGSLPPAAAAKVVERAPAAPPPPLSEDDLFRDATKGVARIRPEERNHAGGRTPLPPSPVTPLERDHAEALAELAGLVSGTVRFDISDGDEHVEGMVAGLDLRILRKLRAGELAYQAHLDLHGMTAEEAKGAVREFVLGAVRDGKRCVLLIHGRGLKSRDRRPVLKDALKQWLTRGELGRVVLAFSTARACDGGSGAMYVLLRRERREKNPFVTLQGAKA
jgi:DNA-nicking Smr family endonuclease